MRGSIKTTKNKYTTAVILAAGIGSRFSSSIHKQRLSILGKSLIARVAEAFYLCDDVDSIIVVTRDEDIDFVNYELRFISDKLHAVIPGGECRAESAKIGFMAVPIETTHVAIHDAARCLIQPNDISAVIRAAHDFRAASAVSRVVNTVKKVSRNNIIGTVSRDELVFAETPQVFACDVYEKALSSEYDSNSITDDNMLVEGIGQEIFAVLLSEENPKITYPRDVDYAEFLLKRREKCLDIE